jgi:hypothetical protein
VNGAFAEGRPCGSLSLVSIAPSTNHLIGYERRQKRHNSYRLGRRPW